MPDDKVVERADTAPVKVHSALESIYSAKTAFADWDKKERNRRSQVAAFTLEGKAVPSNLTNSEEKNTDASLGETINTSEREIYNLYGEARRAEDEDYNNPDDNPKNILKARIEAVRSGIGINSESNDPVNVAEAIAFTKQAMSDLSSENGQLALDLLRKAPFILGDRDLSLAAYESVDRVITSDPLLNKGKSKELLNLLLESGSLPLEERRRLEQRKAMITGSEKVKVLPDAENFLTVDKAKAFFAESKEKAGVFFENIKKQALELAGKEVRDQSAEHIVIGMVEQAVSMLPVIQEGQPGLEVMINGRKQLADALQAIMPNGLSVFEFQAQNSNSPIAKDLNVLLNRLPHGRSIEVALNDIHTRIVGDRMRAENERRMAERIRLQDSADELAALTSADAPDTSISGQDSDVKPAEGVVGEVKTTPATGEQTAKQGGRLGKLFGLLRNK
jgi:hypothetical protein